MTSQVQTHVEAYWTHAVWEKKPGGLKVCRGECGHKHPDRNDAALCLLDHFEVHPEDIGERYLGRVERKITVLPKDQAENLFIDASLVRVQTWDASGMLGEQVMAWEDGKRKAQRFNDRARAMGLVHRIKLLPFETNVEAALASLPLT